MKKTREDSWRLALALASGERIGDWAQRNGINRRTASRWARTEQFQAALARYRQEIEKRALRLAAQAAARGPTTPPQREREAG
jgi:hypothetical protein